MYHASGIVFSLSNLPSKMGEDAVRRTSNDLAAYFAEFLGFLAECNDLGRTNESAAKEITFSTHTHTLSRVKEITLKLTSRGGRRTAQHISLCNQRERSP